MNTCKNSLPFLFGTDSATKATMFFNKALEQAREEDKHKYLLITDKSNYNLHDANLQFKDSYVFYSPKITYGVDFNNIDCPQDVFIYIKGNSIQPSGVFQQTTRCRYINTLYYYGELSSKEANYNNIDEV